MREGSKPERIDAGDSDRLAMGMSEAMSPFDGQDPAPVTPTNRASSSMNPRHIAVIDVGKTNAKLALVEAGSLRELAVATRPNTVLPGPPWPHTDLDGHWRFFLEHLAAFQERHGVDAISVTAHGASAVLLDAGGDLAAPMLDYEHAGPDALAASYDAIRPPFAETGSPRLPHGLNLGAQLHWLFRTQPDLRDRTAHILTYPQYWGWRLTGELASDITSLGCHTDLWNPWQGRFSSLIDTLGLAGKIAPPRQPADILGRLRPEIAAATGLAPGTAVACGIHDSNASLYPYILTRKAPFSVVSTGTWVVSMAIGGRKVVLDPARDVLVNVSATGAPVPSARFMGGREFEIICAGRGAASTAEDRAHGLARMVAILPAVENGSGPFPERRMAWHETPRNEGERLAALSFYLALMTHTCLDLIGADGPIIVAGPFARNRDFLDMLASLSPEGVEIATSATGTSGGAALLFASSGACVESDLIPEPADAAKLRAYARWWQVETGSGSPGA